MIESIQDFQEIDRISAIIFGRIFLQACLRIIYRITEVTSDSTKRKR